MYSINIYQTLNFLTDEYIPVYSLVSDDGSSQWVVQDAATDGSIDNLEIIGGGSGYIVGNVISIATSTGDGNFAATVATVSSGAITSVTIANAGLGYRDGVVSVAGGTGAILKPVFSPIGGHGSNAKEELEGIYAMVKCVINEDEGGVLTTTIGDDFRQLFLIANPLETAAGVKLVLTGYPNINLVAGDIIEVQGSSPLVTGTVVHWNYDTGELWITTASPTGAFVAGQTLLLGVDPVGTVFDVTDPASLPAIGSVYIGADVVYGSGKILYIENRERLQRNADQSEDIRLVIEF